MVIINDSHQGPSCLPQIELRCLDGAITARGDFLESPDGYLAWRAQKMILRHEIIQTTHREKALGKDIGFAHSLLAGAWTEI